MREAVTVPDPGPAQGNLHEQWPGWTVRAMTEKLREKRQVVPSPLEWMPGRPAREHGSPVPRVPGISVSDFFAESGREENAI
jgi:hypothetical protein